MPSAVETAASLWLVAQIFDHSAGWICCDDGDESQTWRQWPQDVENIAAARAISFGLAARPDGPLQPPRAIAAPAVEFRRLGKLPLPPSLVIPYAEVPIGIWLLDAPIAKFECEAIGLVLADMLGSEIVGPVEMIPLEGSPLFRHVARPPRAATYPPPQNLFTLLEQEADYEEPVRYSPHDVLALLDFDPEVEEQVARIERRTRAQAVVRQREDARALRFPSTSASLAEELLRHDAPVEWSIEGLHVRGGNSLLAAEFKAGKTTMVLNVLRALADEQPFLGEYGVGDLRGRRVAWWNYEVGQSQANGWLRDLDISNDEAVAVAHLRGTSLPVHVTAAFDWIVRWLTDRNVGFWIVDPFAAAFGGDENSNQEVGEFLRLLDRIKVQADVEDLLLVHHTGRRQQDVGREHGRGATRLDDWADSRWVLSRQGEYDRKFRAHGRDVDTGVARLLTYEPNGRRLLYASEDVQQGRARSARESKDERNAKRLLRLIGASPGVTAKELREQAEIRSAYFTPTLKLLEERGHIRVDKQGTTRRHFLIEAAVDA